MMVNPYVYFGGNCEQAIRFYASTLGAEIQFQMRYKEGPAELIPPGGEDQIFHATLKLGNLILNMCDMPNSGDFKSFALIAHFDTVEEADEAFQALRHNGSIKMALAATPWAKRYGIVIDQFGMIWKIQVNR